MLLAKRIAKVALGLPLDKTFDYFVPVSLRKTIKLASRVRIVFNQRKMIGYVWGLTDKSNIKKLKPILEVLDERPLFSREFLSFLSKVASYYSASKGEMIEAAIPALLREGRILEQDFKFTPLENFNKVKGTSLTGFSYIVYRTDEEEKKYKFFSEKISQARVNNRQAILLLPDTSLIAYWNKHLERDFKEAHIVCLHSRLSKTEALSAWLKIKSGQADIVIGSRNAVFAPLPNLGLIIVDSEDSFVYKQETRPYYNARDIAIMLARERKITLVLSSISPSLETFYYTLKNKFKLLTELGGNKKEAPAIKIIDLKVQSGFKRHKFFSLPLSERIRAYLTEKKKILIFLNRRGFSTYVRCRQCAYLLRCERCSAGLIYHYQEKKLKCPYCNYQNNELKTCPKCNHDLIYFGGFGIERIESEAHRMFPGEKIICVDSTKEKLDISTATIIIMTQFGLKQGLIEPKVNLSVIISVDNMLNFAELRSSEDTFRILLKLRALSKEEIVLQTYYPEHRVFKYLKQADYISFAKEELKDRKSLKLPPFRHLISINLRAVSQQRLTKCAQDLYQLLSKAIKDKKTQIFPPIQDVPFRLRSKFRLQILIKTAKVENTNHLIKGVLSELKGKHGININVNVDI